MHLQSWGQSILFDVYFYYGEDIYWNKNVNVIQDYAYMLEFYLYYDGENLTQWFVISVF